VIPKIDTFNEVEAVIHLCQILFTPLCHGSQPRSRTNVVTAEKLSSEASQMGVKNRLYMRNWYHVLQKRSPYLTSPGRASSLSNRRCLDNSSLAAKQR
jgi:hypothetical protein